MLSDPGPALLYLACAMFGLGVGNTTSLPSVIVQAEFPRAAFGQVVSTIIAINQFTYSFGPGILGWLRDGFGSYDAALVGCLALQLVAVAILLFGGSDPSWRWSTRSAHAAVQPALYWPAEVRRSPTDEPSGGGAWLKAAFCQRGRSGCRRPVLVRERQAC